MMVPCTRPTYWKEIITITSDCHKYQSLVESISCRRKRTIISDCSTGRLLMFTQFELRGSLSRQILKARIQIPAPLHT